MQQQSKPEAILRAARRVFMLHGYAAASMDKVAAAAAVSKATVYAYFADKRELFAAVTASEAARYAGSLSLRSAPRGALPRQLLVVGRQVLDLLLDPETISAYRMVVAESGRAPELGQVFHQSGPQQLLQRLEQFFAGSMLRDDLRRADARRAAEQFVGLIRGDLQLRALLGVAGDLSARARNSAVRAGVAAFWRVYQPVARAARKRRP